MAPAPHIARKRFGQHFLHDPIVIQRILDAIAPAEDDCVAEIGPGQGALTVPLLGRVGQLHVVEIDRDLAHSLQRRAEEEPRLEVHQGDALRFDFCGLCDSKPVRIVGNLPYNISTPLLFHLAGQQHCLRDIHAMLQKEVVDRIVAKPGGKEYGRLSVMLQYWFHCEALFNIGTGAFQPAPKVQSAFVRLRPYETAPVQVRDPADLSRLVNQAFTQRRKTLRNALKGLLSAQEIADQQVDPGQRPETIDLAGFARLADALSEKSQ
jgi:16S rRNA (adenine1518-N6/adenine1519-N6)-dimethyltransferase